MRVRLRPAFQGHLYSPPHSSGWPCLSVALHGLLFYRGRGHYPFLQDTTHKPPLSFFLSVRLRPLSPPQFLLLLYTNIPSPDWRRRHTHTALELGSKMVYNVCCQRVEVLLYCLYSSIYLHSTYNLYIIWIQNGTHTKQVKMRTNLLIVLYGIAKEIRIKYLKYLFYN